MFIHNLSYRPNEQRGGCFVCTHSVWWSLKTNRPQWGDSDWLRSPAGTSPPLSGSPAQPCREDWSLSVRAHVIHACYRPHVAQEHLQLDVHKLEMLHVMQMLTATHVWLGVNVGTIVYELSHHLLLPCQGRDVQSSVPLLQDSKC